MDSGMNVSPRSILVVEDEPAIADAVRVRLQSEGYQVRVAHDGPQALEIRSLARLGLVGLDLMLIGGEGVGAALKIPSRDGGPRVACSTRAAAHAARAARLAG